MITAIDSSVLLDILTDDPHFRKDSLDAVVNLAMRGRLIASPIVIAEIFPILEKRATTEKFLSDFSIEFVDLGLEASLLGGGIFMRYQANRGLKKQVLADFLVGAHAVVHAEGLLTRDKGFYRPYFKDLKILNPTAVAN